MSKYTDAFQQLHCDLPGVRPRPQKAGMLLAVSLLAEADELQQNRIEYDNRLLEIFRSLFKVARQHYDKETPYNPFFCLKSEGFWQLHPKRDRAEALKHMPSIRGPGQLRDAVAYASVNPELYALSQYPDARRELQAVLIQRYCPHATDAMWTVLKEESQIETPKQNLQSHGVDNRYDRFFDTAKWFNAEPAHPDRR